MQTQTLLFELSPQSESLEDAFLLATAGAQEYQSGGSLPPPCPIRLRRTARRWAMPEAIRSEWIKLSTLTVNKVFVIVAIGFPIVVTALVAGLTTTLRLGRRRRPHRWPRMAVVLLLGVVCTIGMSGEFGYNTIRPTFAAQPARLSRCSPSSPST